MFCRQDNDNIHIYIAVNVSFSRCCPNDNDEIKEDMCQPYATVRKTITEGTLG